MNGSRGSLILDYARKFTLKVEEKDQEFMRVYNFVIPLGTPFEEIYEVLEEIKSDVKKMEEKSLEEKKAQESSTQESSTQNKKEE